MYIFGSGLSGCLAAIHFPNSVIIERSDGPVRNHYALLRMRTEAISQLTGIPFKKVTVDKWIARDGKTTNQVTLNDIIQYSKKTNNIIAKRSIHDLAPEVRYIPPDDLHLRLLERLDGRIKFDESIEKIDKDYIVTSKRMIQRGSDPVISTLPIKVNAIACDVYTGEGVNVSSRMIFASHYIAHDYDMYTTVYFPGSETSVYRASIAGNRVIMESMLPITEADEDVVMGVFRCNMFTAEANNMQQQIGKMVPMDDDIRKQLIYSMTVKANMYSLGRFACWRQILLDDVVKDIYAINRMMNTHPYDRSL